MKKRILAVLCGVVFSLPASAGQGWTGSRAILALEFYNGGVEIRLAGSGTACTSTSEYGVAKTWTKIETNQPNEKQLIAALLMAFSAGKAISVHCPNAADWSALDRLIVEP